ncbi:hypothetical protein FB645_006250 [Coemansia sp. IMI 203386]|nr:hypothetical protein FB645_006250 [Coemansia sp. IMI 203386]
MPTTNNGESARTQNARFKETPLPWAKLSAIIGVRLCESINFTLILPFMYKMVSEFDTIKDPKEVAFYAGLILTSLSICQTFSVMYWGRLSDKIGRRPVLLMGLFGDTVTTLLFGFSKSYRWALVTRCLNGICVGNSPVAKSAVAEMSDDSNRPRMMALLPLIWNFGSVFGAAIGGMLANPVEKYPRFFGDSVIFKEFPYLLPCLVSACLTLTCLFVGFFRFEETLVINNRAVVPASQTQQSGSRNEATPLLRQQEENVIVEQQPEVTLRQLLTPIVIHVLITNSLMSIASAMSDQLLPIFSATEPREGGLGFDTRQVGYTYFVSGFAVLYLQLVAYPRWALKYGSLLCYQSGLKIMTPYFIFMPFLSILARQAENIMLTLSPEKSVLLSLPAIPTPWGSYSVEYMLLWLLLAFLLLVRITGNTLAFTSINLITSNTAPSRNYLGIMNGTQQLVMGITRIVGPLISGSTWSWSLKHSLPYPFNHHFAWLLCAAAMAIASFMSHGIPDSVNKFASDNANTVAANADEREE